MDIKGFLLAGLQKVAAHTWYSCVHRDDDETTTLADEMTTLADEMDTALKGFVGVSKLSGSASTYILNFTRADGSGSTSGSSKIHAFSMASQTLAGMMSAADKAKLDSLPMAANIANVSLVVGDMTAAVGTSAITLTLWTPEDENLQQVQLPAATPSNAGVMSAADKAGLDTLRILLRNPQLAAWLAPRTTGITADVSYNVPATQIDISTLQSGEKVVGVTNETLSVMFMTRDMEEIDTLNFTAGVEVDLSAILDVADIYYVENAGDHLSATLTLRIIEA